MWKPTDKQLEVLMNPFQKLSFPKPLNWNELKLFEKSKVYGLQLKDKEGLYSDKLEAKEIAKSYNLKVAKTVRILEGPNDIKISDINPNHILKSTHGSGWNIDLHDEKNLDKIKKKLRMWNKIYNPVLEPHYKYIKPRFFIEEKIEDKIKSDYLITYRFRCIRGICIAIRITVYDKKYDYFPDWTPMKKNPEPALEKPVEINELLEIAQKMASEFEFVRIDLYLGKDGIYFSEYTFTPNVYEQIYSDSIEKELGLLWT